MSETDPEPYGVRYDDNAGHELDRLKRKDPPLRREALDTVWRAREDPHGYGYPLRGEWEGCYARHFGDDRWRVVWEPNDADEYIGVLVIEKRGAQRRRGQLYEQTRPDMP